jgi:hypothetical protein
MIKYYATFNYNENESFIVSGGIPNCIFKYLVLIYNPPLGNLITLSYTKSGIVLISQLLINYSNKSLSIVKQDIKFFIIYYKYLVL